MLLPTDFLCSTPCCSSTYKRTFNHLDTCYFKQSLWYNDTMLLVTVVTHQVRVHGMELYVPLEAKTWVLNFHCVGKLYIEGSLFSTQSFPQPRPTGKTRFYLHVCRTPQKHLYIHNWLQFSVEMNTRGSKKATTFIPFQTNYDYGADYQIKAYFHTFLEQYYVMISKGFNWCSKLAQ